MTVLSERVLRNMVRKILREDAYDKGRFSPERLRQSILSYTSGDLATQGVRPDQAREVALDDLRVAFGEMGFDVYASIQSAVVDRDRNEVESIVRELLDNEFVSSLEPLRKMGLTRLEDILLPGDFDELVRIIVDDIMDGDGLVTIG